mmetsp:Transcript_63653/g.109327  ORF Transcript_63653/g.109327 Transcript_63653/m.109327 type:complete len:94 (+) Transcript_63653:560-841(+)
MGWRRKGSVLVAGLVVAVLTVVAAAAAASAVVLEVAAVVAGLRSDLGSRGGLKQPHRGATGLPAVPTVLVLATEEAVAAAAVVAALSLRIWSQ